jgi:hypothetical protein
VKLLGGIDDLAIIKTIVPLVVRLASVRTIYLRLAWAYKTAGYFCQEMLLLLLRKKQFTCAILPILFYVLWRIIMRME